jgi:signal transduction histidine kinase
MQLSTVVSPIFPSVLASGFLPHGYCYLWNKPLLWTHLLSDVLIGLSYVTISASLAVLLHRIRRDVPFSFLFIAFGVFIIACGMTHFMEVWTLWKPYYWLSGGVKTITAAASVTTAIIMPFIIPRIQTTIYEAKQSRTRELAAERAAALEASNELLHNQAIELEQQTEEAHSLARELEESNDHLQVTIRAVQASRNDAERARREADDARRKAEAANAAKSQFLAAMSHELRTPLNAICGYVQLLELGLRGPITEDQAADLGRIQTNQRHLLRLINDVLHFTQLGAGQVEYHIAEVQLHTTLRATESMVLPQVRSSGLKYVCEPCDPELSVRADPDKLQQIILNLLGNAIKFTPSNGRINLSCETSADGVCLIKVSDTGPGIPADKLEAIFDPFVQVERKLNQPTAGIGLGLAISRELARSMGGDLTVVSHVGGGSTFTLQLPLSLRHSDNTRAGIQSSGQAGGAIGWGGPAYYEDGDDGLLKDRTTDQ